MKRESAHWPFFALALLKTTLDFFHARTDGDQTLKTQEGNSFDFALQRNLATLQPPLPGSVKCFSLDPWKSLISPGTISASIPPIVAVTGTQDEV